MLTAFSTIVLSRVLQVHESIRMSSPAAPPLVSRREGGPPFSGYSVSNISKLTKILTGIMSTFQSAFDISYVNN